jgi:hypothetical protein
MILKWLKNFFGEDKKPTESISDMVAESLQAKNPVVGEPVISLAKSILETGEWVLEDRSRPRSHVGIEVFTHKAKALQVVFTVYTGWDFETVYTCQAGWMTPDEKSYMVSCYLKYKERVEAEEERQRQLQLVADREKFMVLVNN